MTNYEHIKNMSVEEMAELIDSAEGAGYEDGSITPENENGFHMKMLDWLKQEVQHE